ncbi:RagB/SusD family nutrient uptake outer membrane protein [Mucilaginibacter sp. cycad4]|uniref:RagB/SusD family nutrient uptake outer membrane protein n=1 Tax=Mucilaginibacter sp. cycad4 TaxID=3342096 RepID=UPI002AAAFD3C|nr:RagB/SusD family nutrient uptake outer membrane protein [Mucilaginibacter gossypii]WPU97612.1 RagB/SusD family nutrient uptake outer membrane protein [Mucilaginibacter gossypii]
MKKYIKYLVCVMAVSLVATTGCKKDFFNRPPEDAITVDNFYQTNDQVTASTNALYNSPWFNWVAKSGWAITELAGGNGRTYSDDVISLFNFSLTDINPRIADAWNSLFTVVAQSNALINNLPVKASSSVDKAVLNNALGEAHLMRALAYFHIVRIWGNVPIIENSVDFVNNFQVNTNPVTDIYKFIINDLKFAEANCTPKIRAGASIAQGHVSSGSASALLAKVYLYMDDYTNARAEAEKVINSGEFKLYRGNITNDQIAKYGYTGLIDGKNYNDLFKTVNNNNEESVIALQWAGGAAYGHGNPQQASFAIAGVTGTGDGYSVLGPTIDLQNAYEPGDTRLHGTIMKAGDFYPEINQAGGGFTVPANVNSQGTKAGIKKYVVGTPADNGGIGAAQSAANCTYMMRYAEVLLIAAEAILGANNSTTDVSALKYYNMVRNRAGLAPVTSFTKTDMFHERRIELAIEGDYWFDLERMDGWQGILNVKHPKALAVIANQERGTYSNDTPPQVYSDKKTAKDAFFNFPIPQVETATDPKLLDPPVPYVFK